MTPAAIALSEYRRRKDRAAIDVANRPSLRPRAEANLSAWLAIVLLAGGDHPDAAPALDRYRGDWPALAAAEGQSRANRHAALAEAEGQSRAWTDAQVRAAAASWLAPYRAWARHLSHELGSAMVRAEHAVAEANGQSRADSKSAASDAREAAAQRYRSLKSLAAHLGLTGGWADPLPTALRSPHGEAGQRNQQRNAA